MRLERGVECGVVRRTAWTSWPTLWRLDCRCNLARRTEGTLRRGLKFVPSRGNNSPRMFLDPVDGEVCYRCI